MPVSSALNVVVNLALLHGQVRRIEKRSDLCCQMGLWCYHFEKKFTTVIFRSLGCKGHMLWKVDTVTYV